MGEHDKIKVESSETIPFTRDGSGASYRGVPIQWGQGNALPGSQWYGRVLVEGTWYDSRQAAYSAWKMRAKDE